MYKVQRACCVLLGPPHFLRMFLVRSLVAVVATCPVYIRRLQANKRLRPRARAKVLLLIVMVGVLCALW